MFEIKMTREEIIDGLRSSYGKEFTAADNFKSYDELKTRLDIVLSGKTVVGNVAETIEESPVETKTETKETKSETTDDTLSYFEKLANA